MTSTGLIVAAAVLVIGAAIGWWRRRTDGTMRTVGSSRPAEAAQPAAPGGGVAVSGTETPATSADDGEAGDRLDPALLTALGVGPASATLLQFSSEFCSPCRALRRVGTEVAAQLPGVRHVEVDAESHLDAVRALGIWRTPTLLVLDADGRVVKRATGVPAKPALIEVLGEILGPA